MRLLVITVVMICVLGAAISPTIADDTDGVAPPLVADVLGDSVVVAGSIRRQSPRQMTARAISTTAPPFRAAVIRC
jgi:hypothetical protein